MMYVRHDTNANGHVDGDYGLDDAGTFPSSHGSEQAIPDRYKLVLFNNEVLRLDSVLGTVWILDVQRDPRTHQMLKPQWVAVEPPPWTVG